MRQQPTPKHYQVARILQSEAPLRSKLNRTALEYAVRGWDFSELRRVDEKCAQGLLDQAHVRNLCGCVASHQLRHQHPRQIEPWLLQKQIQATLDQPSGYNECVLGAVLENPLCEETRPLALSAHPKEGMKYLVHSGLPAVTFVGPQLPEELWLLFLGQVEVQSHLSGSFLLITSALQQIQIQSASLQAKMARQKCSLITHGGFSTSQPKHFYRDAFVVARELEMGLDIEDFENFGVFFERLVDQQLISLQHDDSFICKELNPKLARLCQYLSQNFKRVWEAKDPGSTFYLARAGVQFSFQMQVFEHLKRNVYQVYFQDFLDRFTREMARKKYLLPKPTAHSKAKKTGKEQTKDQLLVDIVGESFQINDETLFAKLFLDRLVAEPKVYRKIKNLVFLNINIADCPYLSKQTRDKLVHKINILGGGYIVDQQGLDTSKLTSIKPTKAEHPEQWTWDTMSFGFF